MSETSFEAGAVRQFVVLVAAFAVALAGCRGRQREPAAKAAREPAAEAMRSSAEDPWAAPAEAPAPDYVVARHAFRTKLARSEPSPQPWEPVTLAEDAREIEYTSAALTLKAWRSAAKAGRSRRPAVVFLHGGFAFGAEDWDMAKPFRDAGFIVLMPMLRGENGLPGAFSLYYDEVDDVLAAADVLASQPDVDPARIYITGHSAGGALAMLAAMSATRFRAVASLSGSPDTATLADETDLIPFDPSDANEFRMRSPLSFATSFKCPARLYYGDQERWLEPLARETARRAKAAGLDVEAVEVIGDHFSMTTPAITRALAFFEQQR